LNQTWDIVTPFNHLPPTPLTWPTFHTNMVDDSNTTYIRTVFTLGVLCPTRSTWPIHTRPTPTIIIEPTRNIHVTRCLFSLWIVFQVGNKWGQINRCEENTETKYASKGPCDYPSEAAIGTQDMDGKLLASLGNIWQKIKWTKNHIKSQTRDK
jgi:hypothetical protein